MLRFRRIRTLGLLGETGPVEEADRTLGGLSPTADKALRIAIVGLILAAVGGAVRWRMLAVRLGRAERLYRHYQYEDAADLLEPLVGSPLARIRLRGRARRTLLLCKAHLAAEERTLAGYETALRHLAAARDAGADPDEVDEYVKAYTAEKEKLKAGAMTAPPKGENP